MAIYLQNIVKIIQKFCMGHVGTIIKGQVDTMYKY